MTPVHEHVAYSLGYTVTADEIRRQADDRLARIKAMPRIRFWYGKDWHHDVSGWRSLRVSWGKREDADEGEYIYEREISLSWVWPIVKIGGRK